MDPVLTKEEIVQLFNAEMPDVAEDLIIDSVGPMTAQVRYKIDHRHIRAGGTVSGPTMFKLSDLGVYVAILAMVGPKTLTVTTNASIDFMRKPSADADLICKVRILKLGKVLVLAEGLLFSDGTEAPVARMNMTFSIPPK